MEGEINNSAATFTLHELREIEFFETLYSWIQLDPESFVCMNCGLLWMKIHKRNAEVTVANYGNAKMRLRMENFGERNEPEPSAGENPPKCVKCHGERTADGYLGQMPCFKPHRESIRRVISLNLFSRPKIGVEKESHICLDCGTLWSNVDRIEAAVYLKNRGTDSLRARLGL